MKTTTNNISTFFWQKLRLADVRYAHKVHISTSTPMHMHLHFELLETGMHIKRILHVEDEYLLDKSITNPARHMHRVMQSAILSFMIKVQVPPHERLPFELLETVRHIQHNFAFWR